MSESSQSPTGDAVPGKELAKALLIVQQGLCDNPVRRMGDNPHFKSKYIRLQEIMDVLRPLLCKAGISVVTQTVGIKREERFFYVVTQMIVTHAESGESIILRKSLPIANETVQTYGSIDSYAVRYLYMLTFGITDPAEDDDGEAATPVKETPPLREIRNQHTERDGSDAIRTTQEIANRKPKPNEIKWLLDRLPYLQGTKYNTEDKVRAIPTYNIAAQLSKVVNTLMREEEQARQAAPAPAQVQAADEEVEEVDE